jgi:hypothetical protein
LLPCLYPVRRIRPHPAHNKNIHSLLH